MSIIVLIAIYIVFVSISFAQVQLPGYIVDCQGGYCKDKITVGSNTLPSRAECAVVLESFTHGMATAFSYNFNSRLCLVYSRSCCGNKCFIDSGDKQDYIYIKDPQAEVTSTPRRDNVTSVTSVIPVEIIID